jgi:hypothetical protein
MALFFMQGRIRLRLLTVSGELKAVAVEPAVQGICLTDHHKARYM